MGKFRDLDKNDSIIDEHFSNDKNIKIGIANKDRKLPPVSNEKRDKISASLKGHIGYWRNKQQPTELRQQKSEALKGKPKTKDHALKISASKKGVPGTNDKRKPIVVPYGIFRSRKEAAEKGFELGIINASKKIDSNLKKDPANYYYISKEEYFTLTGKEL
jgi:hypothetical protein